MGILLYRYNVHNLYYYNIIYITINYNIQYMSSARILTHPHNKVRIDAKLIVSQ